MSRRLNTNEKTADSKLETSVTVFTAGNVTFMSKRFTLRDGVIVKSPAPLLYTGTGETRMLPSGLADLPGILAGLGRNQVLCLGVPREAHGDTYPVTTAGGGGDGVTRTKENYVWPSAPIVLLDLDADVGWRGSPVSLHDVYPILCDLLGMEGFGAVVYPSSSAGVYIDGAAGTGTGEVPISIHCYIQLADDRLIPILQEVLRTRSWATGRGYVKLSAAGTMLYRGVFDDSVFDPSRLVYEAPPVLGAGLGRHVFPPVIIPGGRVNVIPPVTQGEIDLAAEAMREAREAMVGRAAEVREAYELGVVTRLLERNPEMDPGEAAVAASGLVDRRVLPLDFELALSRVETITVRELLANAVKYDGRAIPDPHEGVDYGITTAKFYANGLVRGGVGEPVINSFAHGLTLTYWFEQDCMDDFDVVPDEAELASDTDDVAEEAPLKLWEKYIHLKESDRYYDVTDGTDISRNALNTLNQVRYQGTKNSPLAATFLATSGKMRSVAGIGWEASDKQFIVDGLKEYINSYHTSTVKPIPGDVSKWLGLCKYICGDYVDMFLDHLAFTLQCPGLKIRWQILVQGKPRTGKSLMLRPLKVILGKNARVVPAGSHEKNWGDVWARAKLVAFEEVYQGGNAKFYNDIKAKLSDDDFETLDIKCSGQLLQRNLYSIYLFTNHANAIHMDTGERKLLVIKAPDTGYGIAECLSIEQAVDNGTLANHVYDYLLTRDVTSFNYSALPVMTPAALEMCDLGKTSAEMILDEILLEAEDKRVFLAEDLRRRLSKTAYNTLAGLLQARGYVKGNGQKKVDGKNRTTPTYWYQPGEGTNKLSARELYDLITNQTDGDFDDETQA